MGKDFISATVINAAHKGILLVVLNGDIEYTPQKTDLTEVEF
jgi:hypothetical protein